MRIEKSLRALIMTDLIDTVQLQEIDDAYVELFDVTLPSGAKVYIFNGLDDGTANIYFPSKTLDTDSNSATHNKYPLKEYFAIPVSIDGVEINGAGVSPRPSLRIANIPTLTRSISNDENGTGDEETLYSILVDEGLYKNESLLNTRIEYRKTLFSNTYKSTDAHPTASPVEFPSQTYIIDRVASEDSIMVEFELASPIDVEGVKVPGRVVIGRYCVWRYQGGTLNNEGGCNWALSGNGRFFNEKDELITRDISTIAAWSTSGTYAKDAKVKTTADGHTQIWEALRAVPANKDPTKHPSYWKRLDVCSKTLTGCKKRFQGNNTNDTLNTAVSLPFGGFPGSRKFK